MLNTTANAVTGGVKIGTTYGGTDVVAAQAVGANAVADVLPTDLLKKVFTADQILYIQPVTAWNNANLKVRVVLTKLF